MITINDLHWRHAGSMISAHIGDYIITDTSIANPKTTKRFNIYGHMDGEEIHLESLETLSDLLHYLNNVAAL